MKISLLSRLPRIFPLFWIFCIIRLYLQSQSIPMAEFTTVEVRVTPILKEYFHSVYQSDIIPVTQSDLLSTKIKYLLARPPKDYIPCREFEAILRIQMLDFHIGKDSKYINKESCNYLDTQAQRIIFNELNRDFKAIFHNYVLGYVRALNYKDGSQKNGILSFCDTYRLPMNRVNYEMLKKSWDRSEQKCELKKSLIKITPFCPSNIDIQ